jgi:RNA-directed DNA polymerase
LTKSLEIPDKVRELQIKLYRKAKSQPEFRFYLLYDKVYREDVLLRAWVLARANHGAPGVDGKSFEDIETEGVMGWLNGLRKDLQDKTYKPQPVRRRMIAKPGGGERPLGIPTIRDRVAQTAAKLILEPIFEADMEPNAYAYRPKRSAGDALQEVDQLLNQGYTDIVDADLSKYLDTASYCPLIHEICSNSPSS